MPKVVYIFLNGDFKPPENLPESPGDGLVVAADRGLRHVLSLGWKADILVGDFDSLEPELLEAARQDENTRILQYPVEKNETDFELALEKAGEAADFEAALLILGAFGGGRLDMSFANLLLSACDLAVLREKKLRLTFLEGDALIHILKDGEHVVIRQEEPLLISLIPLSPEVSGVTLAGNFKYPMKDGRLRFGYTLGVSNQHSGKNGKISVERGTLAVFLKPLDLDEHADANVKPLTRRRPVKSFPYPDY
ncbi:MAG: thiamine diphosphokinase [Deltaproteobacteria bacterium]|jgi:thiamine pyrophosphokinase|nr:thiamine diphosphokinase [Deltaproteobacteria bacterium]